MPVTVTRCPRIPAAVSRLALAVALLSPGALPGQDAGPPGEPRVTWEIGEGQGAWCIHLLVRPDRATGLVLRGQRPVAARDYAQLVPALRRTIADEPEYATWVPSQVCLWFTRGVTVGRRVYDRADGGKPLALFWWGLAAEGDLLGKEQGLSQIVLATNSSGLKRQMELAFITMERIEINRDSVPESDDELFRLRLDRTDLFLTGHPRPDSTLSVAAISQRSVVKGEANRVWQVEFSAYPTAIGGLPGALRFQGKGKLAEALAESPIRQVGSMVNGGNAWMKFVE